MKMTDEQLDLCIKKIASGDRTELRQLYDEMKYSIYAFALSIVRDRETAEDVMQDTFIKIMLHASSYKLNTKPRAWMFGIARNCCIDVLKKADKNILLENEVFLNIPTSDDLEESVTDTVLVTQAINNLEKLERTIVILYLVMELKQTEIAELLHIPYRVVRAKYKHAIKKLRVCFFDKG